LILVELNTTGGASGTIGLTGSGTSYTVTISNVTGAGTIGINVAQPVPAANASPEALQALVAQLRGDWK
jgi:hypothetical protein